LDELDLAAIGVGGERRFDQPLQFLRRYRGAQYRSHDAIGGTIRQPLPAQRNFGQVLFATEQVRIPSRR
jgi:hypothetical protein